MNATLTTRQLRLVVVLGLVLLCAGAWFALRQSSGTPTTSARSTPSATTATTTTPAPGKSHSHPSTPALVTGGLPVVVAQALRKHAVVVVSLSSPQGSLDKLASAESQAGAATSNAGFVDLNVNHQQNGVAILRKVGLTDTPAVLVIRRPHTIYAFFNGFVDRTVIEQAVADARG